MFAGSGTTGVAAILKSRRTILIEEDQEDCDKCHVRLTEAIKERDQYYLENKLNDLRVENKIENNEDDEGGSAALRQAM